MKNLKLQVVNPVWTVDPENCRAKTVRTTIYTPEKPTIKSARADVPATKAGWGMETARPTISTIHLTFPKPNFEPIIESESPTRNKNATRVLNSTRLMMNSGVPSTNLSFESRK